MAIPEAGESQVFSEAGEAGEAPGEAGEAAEAAEAGGSDQAVAP